MTPYKESYKRRPEERDVGTYNFLRGNLALELSDVNGRLKRTHNITKKIWYLEEYDEENPDETKNLNKIIERELEEESKETIRHEMLYEKLFRLDYVGDSKHFYIELPFTFVMWRQIEQLKMLTQQPQQQAREICMNMPLSRELVQTMSLNILPNAKTVLHFITRNYEFLQRFL